MAADSHGTDAGLESALDVLFESDPNEFAATRKRLASTLRAQGNPAAARRLAAMRRPTKAAAALNVLARQQPELIAALLDRSAELRVAQDRALAGEPGSQRDATRAQRMALTDAADATVAILGGTGEAARAEILSTLQGAAAADDLGAQLRAGRVERTEVAATGFPDGLIGGDVVPAAVLAERRARKKESREPRRRPDAAPERDRAQEREREQERRRDEARRRATDELARAEESLQSAMEDAAVATVAVTAAEARVGTLRAELEAARLEARSAKDRAAATARELARRTRDVARRRR